MSVSFCVLCAFYYPDAERHLPDRTQTCETGRRKLERDRLTVRSMYLRLAEPEPTVWATRWVDRDGRLSLVQDEVADALPAAPVPARSRAPQVTGSRERQLPIDVDQVDLTAGAQVGTVSDPHGDQTGYLSVATVLYDWVTGWREQYFPTETPPVADAVVLLDWLGGVRLEILCETDPEVAEFAEQLAGLRRALRNTLHETPPRPAVMWGVPCKRCRKVSTLTLDPDDPDRYRECGIPGCGLLLTEAEYREHLVAEVERQRPAAA
jgi:hypothetical protein